MSKVSLKEIKACIAGYCAARGIDPTGFRVIRVRVIKQQQPVPVVPKEKPTIAFMRTPLLELWLSDMGQDPVYGTKIANLLEKHQTELGTLLQLATSTEGELLSYRKMGKVYLRVLKEWLATKGLTIGMQFPAKFYPKEKRSKQVPLSVADEMVNRTIEP